MELAPEVLQHLVAMIKTEESFQRHPYRDSKGYLTVGYGRNLDDGGISQNEAELMLQNDMQAAESELIDLFPDYETLSDIRKAVLIDMTVNMGIGNLLNFKLMRTAIHNQDYDTASKEMLNSQWAKEVQGRAQKLAYIMETGSF